MLENSKDSAISSEALENKTMNVQRPSREGVGEEIPEMVATYYFYALLCPFTKQIKYIGRTVDVANRLRNHIYEAKKNNRNLRERWIVSLLRKNTGPVLKVLYEGCFSLEEAISMEYMLIRKFRKRYELKNGSDHGLGGKISTEIVYQYDLNGNFVASYANSNQAYISTGVKDSNILRCCKNENGYGAKTAGDHFWSFIKYEKYPHKFIKEWRNLKGKPVVATNIETGIETIFCSAREAEKITGTSYKKISACCNGRQKSANGFYWKFE